MKLCKDCRWFWLDERLCYLRAPELPHDPLFGRMFDKDGARDAYAERADTTGCGQRGRFWQPKDSTQGDKPC